LAIKINELRASHTHLEAIELELDFMNTKSILYGKIGILIAKLGPKEEHERKSKLVFEDSETVIYKWSECPNKFTVKTPPVKPWEITDILNESSDQYVMYVATNILQKTNVIEDDNIALTIKANYLYSAEFALRR